MTVRIPTKGEIENILRDMANNISKTEEIQHIEAYLDDKLSDLECHVSNRANVERGIIKE